MTTTENGLPPMTPPGTGHSWGYPQEAKKPHRRCLHCGQFLAWDDYFGKYLEHQSYDGYSGGWEATC